ncbi:MAG: aspartate aminotransferase [Halieaceae bacterium]|jgi:aspartate aminotransferase
MLSQFEALPPDPILGLSAAYAEDKNPHKVDLGVGIYKDESGVSPVMDAVKKAEAIILRTEKSKAYLPPVGTPGFIGSSQRLLFGSNHPVLIDGRCKTQQTTGGCGALRVAAQLLVRGNAAVSIWVSNPTWANHVPLLGDAGVTIREYPYYDYNTRSIDFESMLSGLEAAQAGDFVLLHGCCHNPSGADLTIGQWHRLAEFFGERGLIPFVDIAYQGLGDGLDEDAAGMRYLAANLPEMIVASSCSKNFGLYRERTGTLSVIADTEAHAGNALKQMLNVARGIYSMPPSHGAAVVETILADIELTENWATELASMRQRINGLRVDFAEKALSSGVNQDFSHIAREKGMFSFLGITPEQVECLKRDYGIYMVDSSRINVAGINSTNLDYLVESLAAVVA